MDEKEIARQAVESGQLDQLWKWAVALFAGGAAWLWHNTMGRIQTLEEGKLSKTAFSEYTERAETSRREMRENQMKIFDTLTAQDKTLARIEGALSTRRNE